MKLWVGRSLDLIWSVNSFESRLDGFLGSLGGLKNGFMGIVMIYGLMRGEMGIGLSLS
jgi:hypothetical protein